MEETLIIGFGLAAVQTVIFYIVLRLAIRNPKKKDDETGTWKESD